MVHLFEAVPYKGRMVSVCASVFNKTAFAAIAYDPVTGHELDMSDVELDELADLVEPQLNN